MSKSNIDPFQGQIYATALSAIRQLDLEKLRILRQFVDTQIIKRKLSGDI